MPLPEALFTSKKFLVIDDIPDMRSMIQQMLLSLHARDIDMAGNGDQAIELITANHYDAILCDFNLGDQKNGQQILEELHAKHLIDVAQIFILITAENAMGQVMSVVENEPDDYIAKPFNKEILKKRLDNQFERKKYLPPLAQLLQQKQYHVALDYCDKLLATNPKSPLSILKIKSRIALDIGELYIASEIYDEVKKQYDTVPWADFGRGVILYQRQQMDQAKAVFTAITEQYPMYLPAYDWLAKIESSANNFDSANEWMQKAIELSPNIVHRQKSFANLSIQRGDLDMAEKAFVRTINLARNSIYESGENEANLANVEIQKGDVVKALKRLNNVKKHYKDDPTSAFHISMAEINAHKQRGSTQLLEAALKEAGKQFGRIKTEIDTDMELQLARHYLEAGQQEQAEEILRDTTLRHHEDKQVIDKILATYGEHGLSDQGAELVNQASKTLATLNNTGIKIFKDGKVMEAVDFFTQALQQAPNNLKINFNLVRVLIKISLSRALTHHEFNSLLQAIRVIQNRDPKHKELHNLLQKYSIDAIRANMQGKQH